MLILIAVLALAVVIVPGLLLAARRDGKAVHVDADELGWREAAEVLGVDICDYRKE